MCYRRSVRQKPTRVSSGSCLSPHQCLQRFGSQPQGELVQIPMWTILVFYRWVLSQVNNWSKGVCPNRKMSCIGKFRRNLVTMRETMHFYLFEKLVFFLDVALLGVSNNLPPEVRFWAHNSITLLQFIGRISFYSLIIEAPDSKMNTVLSDAAEPKFYVLTPEFLEPRRPSISPSKSSLPKQSKGKRIVAGCKGKSSTSRNHFLGQPGPSSYVSTSLPSIQC